MTHASLTKCVVLLSFTSAFLGFIFHDVIGFWPSWMPYVCASFAEIGLGLTLHAAWREWLRMGGQ